MEDINATKEVNSYYNKREIDFGKMFSAEQQNAFGPFEQGKNIFLTGVLAELANQNGYVPFINQNSSL